MGTKNWVFKEENSNFFLKPYVLVLIDSPSKVNTENWEKSIKGPKCQTFTSLFGIYRSHIPGYYGYFKSRHLIDAMGW